MNKFAKNIIAMTVLFCAVNVAMADRGIGKKAKTKPSFNIAMSTNLRSSIALNIKNGLTYKGSLLSNQTATTGGLLNSTLITYQKGNTVYILPYKHKITMPEIKPGYTGIKMIIRPKK